MKLFSLIVSAVLLFAYTIFFTESFKFTPRKKNKTQNKKHNMSFFNAVQIALIIAAGPILLQLLKAATFAFATPLFWLCAIVYVGMFLWNTFMIAESIGK